MDDDSDFDDEHLESPLSSQGGMCSLDGVLDDHKRHARAQHNALERRRRDNIKDMYTSLKDAVPDMQNERASRAVILRRAIEVIEEKQQQRADLQADCDRLRSETAELEREIKLLKENAGRAHDTTLCDFGSRSSFLSTESALTTSAFSPVKSDSNTIPLAGVPSRGSKSISAERSVGSSRHGSSAGTPYCHGFDTDPLEMSIKDEPMS